MFNPDPKRPLIRIVAAIAGVVFFATGIFSVLWRQELHYVNWFGELVFAPFAVLFGLILFLGALFRPEILGTSPRRHRR
jgi:hypothetical protein